MNTTSRKNPKPPLQNSDTPIAFNRRGRKSKLFSTLTEEQAKALHLLSFFKRKQKRDERRKAHLCTDCGTLLPESDPHNTCETCRWIKKEKRRARDEEHAKRGICRICGKLLPKWHEWKTCDECRKKNNVCKRRLRERARKTAVKGKEGTQKG